jgi:ABC-2 type transport system permease protein
MTNLLKIEWLKIKAYPAFWWVLGVTALAYPGINYAMFSFYNRILNDPKTVGPAIKTMIGNPFSYNEVWHTVGYFSSWFILFPAIIVIMLITNEYTFRTNRQNVIDGWTRKQFLTAKFLDVCIISVLITILYFLVCLLIRTNEGALGGEGTNKMYFIGYFLLLTFSQLSLAFFIGFLVRKSFIALSLYLFLSMILEPLLTGILERLNLKIGQFFPFEISDRMIPPPAFFGRFSPEKYQQAMDSTFTHCIYTVIFTLLVWLFCFRLNAKRDL